MREQVEFCSSISLPLDQFETSNLAFRLALTPREG